MAEKISARAGTLDIELEEHTGLELEMVFKNQTTGNQLNLTGYTFTASVKRNKDARDTLATLGTALTGTQQIATIQTLADSSGSLGGTYFDMDSALVEYRVWLDVDNGSSAPLAGGRTLVEVDIATDDTAPTVAAALQVALDALGDVTASVASDVVTATNDDTGFAEAPADTGSTGFTLTATTVGDQTLTLTFTEANVDDIEADAVWDLRGTPSGGLAERLVEGRIIWQPGVTDG